MTIDSPNKYLMYGLIEFEIERGTFEFHCSLRVRLESRRKPSCAIL